MVLKVYQEHSYCWDDQAVLHKSNFHFRGGASGGARPRPAEERVPAGKGCAPAVEVVQN